MIKNYFKWILAWSALGLVIFISIPDWSLVKPESSFIAVQPGVRFVVVDASGRNVTKFSVADLRQYLIDSGISEGNSNGTILHFADMEVPHGVLDGNNQIFTIVNIPNPANSLILTRNGLVMKRGVDYSISANNITFASGESTPQESDLLLTWYRY